MNNGQFLVSSSLISKLVNGSSSCVLALLVGSSFLFGASILVPSVARAASAECSSISDGDQRNYCEAIAKVDSKYCDLIADQNNRNTCFATVTRDQIYCSRIEDQSKKSACIQASKLLPSSNR